MLESTGSRDQLMTDSSLLVVGLWRKPGDRSVVCSRVPVLSEGTPPPPPEIRVLNSLKNTHTHTHNESPPNINATVNLIAVRTASEHTRGQMSCGDSSHHTVFIQGTGYCRTYIPIQWLHHYTLCSSTCRQLQRCA